MIPNNETPQPSHWPAVILSGPNGIDEELRMKLEFLDLVARVVVRSVKETVETRAGI